MANWDVLADGLIETGKYIIKDSFEAKADARKAKMLQELKYAEMDRKQTYDVQNLATTETYAIAGDERKVEGEIKVNAAEAVDTLENTALTNKGKTDVATITANGKVESSLNGGTKGSGKYDLSKLPIRMQKTISGLETAFEDKQKEYADYWAGVDPSTLTAEELTQKRAIESELSGMEQKLGKLYDEADTLLTPGVKGETKRRPEDKRKKKTGDAVQAIMAQYSVEQITGSIDQDIKAGVMKGKTLTNAIKVTEALLDKPNLSPVQKKIIEDKIRLLKERKRAEVSGG